MPDDHEDEPIQRTPEGAERDALDLPGEGGHEIPVPTRGAVEDALSAISRDQAKPLRRGRRKGRTEQK